MAVKDYSDGERLDARRALRDTIFAYLDTVEDDRGDTTHGTFNLYVDEGMRRIDMLVSGMNSSNEEDNEQAQGLPPRITGAPF
jgi:hypothetical protein